MIVTPLFLTLRLAIARSGLKAQMGKKHVMSKPCNGASNDRRIFRLAKIFGLPIRHFLRFATLTQKGSGNSGNFYFIFLYQLLLFAALVNAHPSHYFIEQGKKLLHEKNYIQAMHCFEDAYAQHSSNQELLEIGNNILALGNIFFSSGDIENAYATFKRLHEIFPQSSTVAYNYGLSCHELADYKNAVLLFEHACSLNPQALDAQTMWAITLIALGEYEKGWQKYEMRWHKPEKKSFQLPCPRWDGKCPLQGKTILLINEGALGDCLQFVRYAQLIKKMGAHVIVQAPASLHTLLSRCPFIDTLISSSNYIGKIDYYSSLMSLPALCNTTFATVPHIIPYIFPDPSLVNHWGSILSQDKKFKIGVCWQADIENDANRPPFAKRSFPAELFEQISQMPNVSLYSLQKTQHTPTFIHNFGPELDSNNGSFMDSAAIIHNLDLVITVDTSIAHLSGALGKTTWLILPFKADWRWLENTISYSPFYQTMKIFRKEKHTSWQAVLDHIKIELIAKTSRTQ